MGILGYSGPQFRLPGDDREARSPEPAGPAVWVAPESAGPLRTEVLLPGSKSLTNRELVLAALADGPSRLRAPLHSRDTALMIAGLEALGTTVDRVTDSGNRFGPDLAITPGPLTGGVQIDCGLAGTVMRFLPPVAALALGPVVFDGDPAARTRPMRTTIDSLRALGVDITDDGRGSLPFSLYGTGAIAGGPLAVDASASSQFISALLMAAARFDAGLNLTAAGEGVPSAPHIAMTVTALTARGVSVSFPHPGNWAVAPGPISGREVRIEADLSNAAPFAAAALITGGTVRIQGWPADTIQVGALLERLLPLFAGSTRRDGASLVIDGGTGLLGGQQLDGVTLDLSDAGELTPTLAALAALAQTPSTLTGIGHLRGHETDRLAALTTELNALGGEVTELADGLHIVPRPLTANADRPWRCYADHRMATAGALLGLAVPGLAVDDIASTAKTMPEFPQLWTQLIRGEPRTASTLFGVG